jgi:hypothetical protein
VLIDGRRHENSVHGALMAPDQWPELTRQGKGHHEILDRQQFGLLSVQPLAGLVVLALRATSVPARPGLSPVEVTVMTMPQDFAGIIGAATLDGADGPAVAGQELVAVACFQLREVTFDQGGECHGDTLLRSTCRRLTRAFMLAAVSCAAISPNWV